MFRRRVVETNIYRYHPYNIRKISLKIGFSAKQSLIQQIAQLDFLLIRYSNTNKLNQKCKITKDLFCILLPFKLNNNIKIEFNLSKNVFIFRKKLLHFILKKTFKQKQIKVDRDL